MAKKKKKKTAKTYDDVSAYPVKSFFVEMLTRDITLSDAMLDLLDNCVDGILRQNNGHMGRNHPYEGFYADIRYDSNEFHIHDNCGGIPWNLHSYAFRMGRSVSERDDEMPTVGVYGIGMKRAIFKIGRHALLQTQNGDDAYDVEITPDWLAKEDEWTIPVKASSSPMSEDGTSLMIESLHDGVSSLFGEDKTSFDKDFKKKVATHYAFIISKGFEVKVNGQSIEPRPTELRFDESESKDSIRPFVYEDSIDGVDVFLAVGFTHPIPSEEDVSEEQETRHYSSMDAGWTIICNDRAVVYCDRSELTGWGEAGVPKYHTQFIAITGIVEFRSNDASKLPTTTTKRGIDASSRLYLQVKNKMREGLSIFTHFTNKWKGRELAEQAQDQIRKTSSKSLGELKTAASDERFTMQKVRGSDTARQYKPKLPMPPESGSKTRRISFLRKQEEVEAVAQHLLGDSDARPSDVGAKCFDEILDRAKK
jgi:hypothetical protein